MRELKFFFELHLVFLFDVYGWSFSLRYTGWPVLLLCFEKDMTGC